MKRVSTVTAGQTFGRLTTMQQLRASNGRLKWHCICTCGVEVDVYGSHLSHGLTRSCGCLQSELTQERNRQRIKHGKWRTNEFAIWGHMISRCHSPTDRQYPRYGGRGITVCDRWRTDFAAFYADMGPRPSRAHSLERVDNDRGYEPDNVVWATHLEQQNNKRSNVRLTVNGETMTASQLARKYGLNVNTVLKRAKSGRTGQDLVAPSDRARKVMR